MSRRAARVDANHGEIVDALRKVGAHVTSLAEVGQGCPDLLISFAQRWYVVELKSAQTPSESHLTAAQKKWHRECKAPAHIAYNVTDAFAIIGAHQEPA